MSLPLTLSLMAVFLALTLFAGWRGARPPDLNRGPRMMPWRFVMLVSLTVCVFLLVHLLNLAGFHTGRADAGY